MMAFQTGVFIKICHTYSGGQTLAIAMNPVGFSLIRLPLYSLPWLVQLELGQSRKESVDAEDNSLSDKIFFFPSLY